MIDPGRLKTRLQIQAPVETGDGQGGVTRSFATLTMAWAEVTPISTRGGGVDVEAGAEGATVKYRILLRSNFVLTLQHRLVDGALRIKFDRFGCAADQMNVQLGVLQLIKHRPLWKLAGADDDGLYPQNAILPLNREVQPTIVDASVANSGKHFHAPPVERGTMNPTGGNAEAGANLRNVRPLHPVPPTA